jgi:hypothetical protein
MVVMVLWRFLWHILSHPCTTRVYSRANFKGGPQFAVWFTGVDLILSQAIWRSRPTTPHAFYTSWSVWWGLKATACFLTALVPRTAFHRLCDKFLSRRLSFTPITYSLSSLFLLSFLFYPQPASPFIETISPITFCQNTHHEHSS